MTSGEFVLLNGETVRLKAFRADTMYERLGGLLRLPALQADETLLLDSCSSIHTVGMPYALDLVYLNKSNKVVKLVHDVVPYRASYCFSARSVLELKAGEIKRLNIKLGMFGSFYA